MELMSIICKAQRYSLLLDVNICKTLRLISRGNSTFPLYLTIAGLVPPDNTPRNDAIFNNFAILRALFDPYMGTKCPWRGLLGHGWALWDPTR